MKEKCSINFIWLGEPRWINFPKSGIHKNISEWAKATRAHLWIDSSLISGSGHERIKIFCATHDIRLFDINTAELRKEIGEKELYIIRSLVIPPVVNYGAASDLLRYTLMEWACKYQKKYELPPLFAYIDTDIIFGHPEKVPDLKCPEGFLINGLAQYCTQRMSAKEVILLGDEENKKMVPGYVSNDILIIDLNKEEIEQWYPFLNAETPDIFNQSTKDFQTPFKVPRKISLKEFASLLKHKAFAHYEVFFRELQLIHTKKAAESRTYDLYDFKKATINITGPQLFRYIIFHFIKGKFPNIMYDPMLKEKKEFLSYLADPACFDSPLSEQSWIENRHALVCTMKEPSIGDISQHLFVELKYFQFSAASTWSKLFPAFKEKEEDIIGELKDMGLKYEDLNNVVHFADELAETSIYCPCPLPIVKSTKVTNPCSFFEAKELGATKSSTKISSDRKFVENLKNALKSPTIGLYKA